MPPLGVNSMAINGDSLELNSKTSAIKIEESCLLVEIKKEIVLENSLRQEADFEATSVIKIKNEFLTEDCSMVEYLPKVGRDHENNFVSIGSDIIDLHPSVIRVKEETQFFHEESLEEDYFENESEGLRNDQENGSRADPMSPQDNGKENYDENNFAGTKSKSKLMDLLFVPSSERQLSCRYCRMKFCATMRTEYSLHLRTHGESPLLCPVCPKEFKQQQFLMRHLETQHLPIPGKQWYHCQRCEARFSCSSTLASHLKTLHRDKYFYRAMCKLCLSKLERDRQLKHLLLIVRSDQKCRYITQGPRGSLPSDLANQMDRDDEQNLERSVSHNAHFEDSRLRNENLFFCETEAERNGESNKNEKYPHYLKNLQKDSLTTDKLTSSNFFCPQCPAAFTRQSSLADHLSAHSVQKLFQCPDCASIYDAQKDFYSHWRYHKGELSHYCDFCPVRFSHCCELVEHFKAVHSVKYWSFDKEKYAEFQQNRESIHHPEAQNDENSTSLMSSFSTDSIDIESVDPSPKDLYSECSVTEQLHPCKFCSMKFFYHNDLTRHVTKHHSETRDPIRSQKSGEEMLDSTAPNYEDLPDSIPITNVCTQSRQKLCSVTHGNGNPSQALSFPNTYVQREQRFRSLAHSCLNSTHVAPFSNTVAQTDFISSTTAQSYPCPCCQAHFINLLDFTKHLKTLHADKLCPSSSEQVFEFEKNSVQNCSKAGEARTSLSAPSSLIPSCFTQLDCTSHTSIRAYLCQFCPTKYSSSNDLMKHLRSCHENRVPSSALNSDGKIKSIFDVPDEFQEFPPSEELYSCEFCSRNFFDSSHLMNHFMAQHSDKYLDPALFVQGSANKSNQYLSNATTLTNLKCPICAAEFIWLSSMIRHMKTHDTDRLL